MKRFIIASLLCVACLTGIANAGIPKKITDNAVQVWTDDYTCIQYLIVRTTAGGVAITPRLDSNGQLLILRSCARGSVAAQ